MDYAFKVTTNGRRVLAACMDLNTSPNIARVAFGSGLVDESTDLADVHALIQYVSDGTIASRAHADDRLFLSIQYANVDHPDITKVFLMREFMIYLTDPDTGEETDFVYGTLGDYIQTIPPYNASYPAAVWTLPLVVTLTSDLTVTISAPAGLVTYDDLTDLINGLGTRILSLTIPTTGWVADSTGDSYKYACSIAVNGVTAELIPDLTVLRSGIPAAVSCGLAPVVQTYDGGVTVYAVSVPTAAIAVSLRLFGDASGYSLIVNGDASSSIPVATSDRLGGVKVGDGLNVDSDGTLSVDTETVMTSADLVNEEEVQQSVKDILDS